MTRPRTSVKQAYRVRSVCIVSRLVHGQQKICIVTFSQKVAETWIKNQEKPEVYEMESHTLHYECPSDRVGLQARKKSSF